MFVRVIGDRIMAYDFVNEPVAFALPKGQGEEMAGGCAAVTPDLSRAVYLTETEMVCIDRAGRRLWTQPLPPFDPDDQSWMRQVEFSLDGKVLWHYRQAAGYERISPATWQVLEPSTGIVLAESELDSSGFGGLYVHPDGIHTVLTLRVDEGSHNYLGRFNGVALEVTLLPLSDRGLLGFSPDGTKMMTVDDDDQWVAFHHYPDCAITGRLRLEDFGESAKDIHFDWISAFLDEHVAVVVLGSLDDEDADYWRRSFLVDTRTAHVIGPLEIHTRTIDDDIEFLGDGTWVTLDDAGYPIRHRRP